MALMTWVIGGAHALLSQIHPEGSSQQGKEPGQGIMRNGL